MIKIIKIYTKNYRKIYIKYTKMNSNNIMKSFLLKEDKKIWPNKTSNNYSAEELQRLCKSIVDNTLSWKITLTTWVWLNDIWVPIRCPSVIIPALEIIRKLVELWISDVHYCIYQANSFIIKENSLNESYAKSNSIFMEQYFKWYISEFYPDILDKITFNFNVDLDEVKLNSIWNKIVELEWDKDIDSLIWNLVKYAESRWKTKESALMYLSANIACNWNVWEYYPVTDSVDDILITIWWRKEKQFFNLWRVFQDKFNSDWIKWRKIISILQSTWEIPPYYPHKWEDHINGEWSFIWLDWTKLHWSVKSDRDIVLSSIWEWFNPNQLIKQILW